MTPERLKYLCDIAGDSESFEMLDEIERLRRIATEALDELEAMISDAAEYFDSRENAREDVIRLRKELEGTE